MNKFLLPLLCIVFILIAPSRGIADVRGPESPMMSPMVNGEQRPCMDCHRRRNVNSNAGVLSSQTFCYECHAKSTCKKSIGGQEVSLLVKADSFSGSRHKFVACSQCHTDVARSPHTSLIGVQCLACHSVHGGSAAHSPHLRVRCEACHTDSQFVVLNRKTDQIELAHVNDKGAPISLAGHKVTDVNKDDFCQRCHRSGNTVGAAAAVLPPKSFLCLPCHYAPLGMGHPMYWVGLLIFLFGAVLTVSFWFKGKVAGEEKSTHRKIALSSEMTWSTIFSREFFSLLKTFIFDVILQRRILQESVKRWSIHSLIYLAFLGRFFLSVYTLIVFNIAPHSNQALALINKNNGFTAFIYDLLGLFIIVGIIWAAIRRFIVKPPHAVSEEQDNIALVIIGILVLSGFIVEGIRILITQIPANVAGYSFIGYLLAKFFSVIPFNWQVVYGYFWYFHALMLILLIAYLPFGKLKHIFLTPLNLLLNRKIR
jgi:nitrate reductase gamma subunit